MATIANLEAILRLDDQMTGQLQKSAGALGKIGTALSTASGFLIAQGVMAATQAVGDFIGVGMDFEAQMANVNSIAQLSADELANLSDQVLNLTNNPGITQGPAQLAAGLYNIQSSGFEGAAAMQVLEASALAATAGMTTTDTAARAIAGTMNAYGQETYTATQIADVFFKVVDSGVITFEELANNLGTTTALAANLGVGIEELGAAYATLTLNNLSATQSETAISNLMRAAINPTTALTEAVQAYGYETAEALIKAEGLTGFLKVLTEASGGSVTALTDLLGTQEAANAALILGGKGAQQYADALADMTEQLNDGGAMQRALEKQMQSSAYQVAKLKQQVQLLALIGFGFLAPAISRVLTGLTRFVGNGLVPFGRYLQAIIQDGDTWNDWLTHLPEPLQRTAHALGSVVEAVADVVRAFGERGLVGAIRTLTTGGELEQIASAFGAIASEAWNAIVAGFNAIPWGGIWDIATAGIQGAIDAAPLMLDVAIDGIATLGEGLAGIAGDLSGWLQGKIFGLTAPDGTGGPSPFGSAGSGIVVEIAQIAIDVLDAIANVTAADIEAWLQEQVDTLGTITGEINDWRIVLNGTPEITSDGGTAPASGGSGFDGWGINRWIQEQTDKINGENGWAIDATNWVMRITGNPQMQVDDFEGWNNLMQLFFQDLFDGSFVDNIGAALDELNLKIALNVVAFMQDIERAWDNLKSVFDVDISLPTPAFDTAGIIGAVADLIMFIDEQIGRLQRAWDRLTFWNNKVNNPSAYIATNPGGATFPETTINTERDFDAIGAYPNADLPAATPIEIPAPNTREFDRVMGEIPGRVQSKMSEAQTSASTYAAGIGSVVGSTIGAMVGNVAALMGAFTVAVGQGMSNALSAAATYTAAIVAQTSSSLGQLPGIAAAATAPIPGIIAGNLAAAAGAAYSAGVAIGQGLAAGMNAMLGAVQAAAANLAAAAAQAANAALGVASPSRVFRQIGEAVGDGLALGIQSREDLVAGSAASLAGASLFDANGGGFSAARSGGGFRNYGVYNEADRYWAPEQALISRGIQRGRR